MLALCEENGVWDFPRGSGCLCCSLSSLSSGGLSPCQGGMSSHLGVLWPSQCAEPFSVRPVQGFGHVVSKKHLHSIYPAIALLQKPSLSHLTPSGIHTETPVLSFSLLLFLLSPQVNSLTTSKGHSVPYTRQAEKRSPQRWSFGIVCSLMFFLAWLLKVWAKNTTSNGEGSPRCSQRRRKKVCARVLVHMYKCSGNCCFWWEQISALDATHGLKVHAVHVAVPGEWHIHVANPFPPAVVYQHSQSTCCSADKCSLRLPKTLRLAWSFLPKHTHV